MSADPRSEASAETSGGSREAAQVQLDVARFERWARILFYALGVLGLLIGILAIDGSALAMPSIVLIVSTLVGVAMLFGVAWGLAVGRSWGRPAATLMLWVLIMIGVLRLALLLFVAGDMTIPVEAILAFLVLTTLPPGQRRDFGQGADRPVAELYAGVYAVAALLPLVVR